MPKNSIQKIALTFVGGTQSVTGANFLLEGPLYEKEHIKILVDCGIEQSSQYCDHCNYEPFSYNPESISVLLVTHAHMDHIGRIPKLVKDGFKGVIYSTPATREISAIMFDDAYHLLKREAQREGKEMLYEMSNVEEALRLWKSVPCHTDLELGLGFSAYFKDAGHILGSAMIEISFNDSKILFTGDLGNSPAPLLPDTEVVTDADYVVMESVYGDRNHEPQEERVERLQKVIEEVISRKGVLLIPSFSIERTQILLYELNQLIESKKISSIPVFLDSPLAIKVTDIYRKRVKNFKESVQNEIRGGDDIFDFPNLKFTDSMEESKAIAHEKNPKIIIAGSGMSHGGRIIHHEKRYLSNPTTTLLFVGYQSAGSLGRRLQDGQKRVNIFDEEITVKAHIETIASYSAHKDGDGLVSFIEPMAEDVKKVFVTMGEPKASLFLVQRLRDYLDVRAEMPKKGDRVELEF